MGQKLLNKDVTCGSLQVPGLDNDLDDDLEGLEDDDDDDDDEGEIVMMTPVPLGDISEKSEEEDDEVEQEGSYQKEGIVAPEAASDDTGCQSGGEYNVTIALGGTEVDLCSIQKPPPRPAPVPPSSPPPPAPPSPTAIAQSSCERPRATIRAVTPTRKRRRRATTRAGTRPRDGWRGE